MMIVELKCPKCKLVKTIEVGKLKEKDRPKFDRIPTVCPECNHEPIKSKIKMYVD